MNEIRKKYLKITFYFYLIWLFVFIIEGLYASKLPTIDLTSRIDRALPLLPGFVWIYVFCYIIPLLALFFIRDWHRFNLALISFAFCTGIAFIGHLTIPIAFPRAPLGHSFSEKMLRYIYVHDFQPGAQNFPSLHVSFSWLIFLTFIRQGYNKLVELSILIITLLVISSTVFIKQHLVIDLIGGTVLAFIVWFTVQRYYFRYTNPEDDPLKALKLIAKRLLPVFVSLAIIIAGIIGLQIITKQ